MADVSKADCIALLDCDLLEEGPMMSLSVRQAWRQGAQVFTVGSAERARLEKTVSIAATPVATLADIPFAEYKNPVVICGSANGSMRAIETAAVTGSKLAFILSGPNAFGAALLAREHGAGSLSCVLSAGKVKGVIAVEADIPPDLLEGLPLVASLDWLSTELVKRSDIFLPTTAWVEMDGIFINNEGRAQRYKKVLAPGLPIKGLDPACHPPRIHRKMTPGGDVRPAWRVIAALIERLGGEKVLAPLGGRWEHLEGLDAEGEGARVV
jgi:NADH-quinone oxidoreductase subunit G